MVELRELNQTVNAEFYVQQMESLNTAIQKERPNRHHGDFYSTMTPVLVLPI